MAPISLKKTIQQYRSLSTNLESKIQQLYSKKTELESRGFVVIEEKPRFSASSPPAASTTLAAAAEFRESQSSIAQKIAARGSGGISINEARSQRRSKSPSSPPNIASSVLDESVEQDRAVAVSDHAAQDDVQHVPAAKAAAGKFAESLNPALVRERMPSLIEESVMAHSSDVTSLVSTATNILIESMQLRLSYVQEVLNKLTSLQQENPKLPTPPELLFSRYEEWVQRNQRLIELNSQLYDLEKLKFELKEKRSKVHDIAARRGQQQLGGELERTLTGVKERERERERGRERAVEREGRGPLSFVVTLECACPTPAICIVWLYMYMCIYIRTFTCPCTYICVHVHITHGAQIRHIIVSAQYLLP